MMKVLVDERKKDFTVNNEKTQSKAPPYMLGRRGRRGQSGRRRELQIRLERNRPELLEQQADFRLQIRNVHELELVDSAVYTKQLATAQLDVVEVLQYESIDILLARDIGSRRSRK